jgi:hypothetical protein
MAISLGTTNLQYKEHILDVMRHTFNARLGDSIQTSQLRFETYPDMIMQDLIYQVQLFVAGKSHQTTEQGETVVDMDTVTNQETKFIENPATWWDHLKQTLGWKWLKVNMKKHEYTCWSYTTNKKYITKNVIHKTINICPHTMVDPALKHMTFLMSEVVK